jgi:hypothetical protein
MLRLIPSNETPPDKFRFTHPEDGWTDIAMDREGWFKAIRKHREDNNYPLPEDWQSQAEDQLCRILPPGWCQQEDGRTPEQFVNARIGFDDIMRATAVFAEEVRQGAPLVSQEVAEARGATCAGCYMRQPVAGCGMCYGLVNLVASVAGAHATKADALLSGKSCLVCKCAAQAQIWLPIDVLAKGVTPEMDELWPPFCWKGKGLRELDNASPP